MRARGFKPSAEHRKRLFSAPHPVAAPAPYASAGSLRPFKPPRFDQGRSGSCGPHALSALLTTAAAAAGTPLPFIPSPRGISSNTLAREQPGDGPLQDTGVAFADMMLAVSLEGIRAIEAPTPDGRFSDVWTDDDIQGIAGAPPANFGLRPTLAEDESSARILVLGPDELQRTALDLEAQMASALDNLKAPIAIGIHATPEFEAYGENDQGGRAYDSYDTASFSDNDGHAVGLYDWRTELDGSLAFWLGNQWPDWGDADGGIWVSGRWARRTLLEAWRIRAALKLQAAIAAQVRRGAA